MCPRVPDGRSDATTTLRERLPTCGRRAAAPPVPCAAGWSHASGVRTVIVAPSTAAISTCSSREVNARPRSCSRSCRVSGNTIRSPAAQPCSGRSRVNVVCDARASPVRRAKVGVFDRAVHPDPAQPDDAVAHLSRIERVVERPIRDHDFRARRRGNGPLFAADLEQALFHHDQRHDRQLRVAPGVEGELPADLDALHRAARFPRRTRPAGPPESAPSRRRTEPRRSTRSPAPTSDRRPRRWQSGSHRRTECRRRPRSRASRARGPIARRRPADTTRTAE